MTGSQHRALGRYEGWAVVNTQPRREQLAQENLERQGFEAYYPRVSKRIRHARRAMVVERPLFAGYLFARVDLGHWRPVLSTLGVRSLVRSGDGLSLLDDDFIRSLKARERDGLVCGADSSFRIGQQVRMEGGAFDGLVATIINLSEKERITVLMTLLSRSVKVHVATRDVVAI